MEIKHNKEDKMAKKKVQSAQQLLDEVSRDMKKPFDWNKFNKAFNRENNLK